MRCPFATWVGTPNYWEGRLPLESIVDHIAQGSLSACDGWFNNPDSSASSHFCIGKAGETHQYADTDDSTWANGVLLAPDITVVWIAQAASVFGWVDKYWVVHPNRRTISIEHEGYSGELWTPEMYEADLRLKRWLLDTHDFNQELTGDLLLGHFQFDSANRSGCPGPTWPRERLMADLLKKVQEEGGGMAVLVRQPDGTLTVLDAGIANNIPPGEYRQDNAVIAFGEPKTLKGTQKQVDKFLAEFTWQSDIVTKGAIPGLVKKALREGTGA